MDKLKINHQAKIKCQMAPLAAAYKRTIVQQMTAAPLNLRSIALGSIPVQMPANVPNTPVQQSANSSSEKDPAAIHQHADRATSGAGHRLPHFERIQKVFPGHNLSGIKAYTDKTAQESTRSMGAHAFTKGSNVAFATPNPSLHTTVHEVTHSLQQKGGLHIPSGVGGKGDRHEVHADTVADAAIRGKPVSHMMAPYQKKTSGSKQPVQGMFGELFGKSKATKMREAQEQAAKAQEQAAKAQQAHALMMRDEAQKKTAAKTIQTKYRERLHNKKVQEFSAKMREKYREKAGLKINETVRRHLSGRHLTDSARHLNLKAHMSAQQQRQAATRTDDSNHEREGAEQVIDMGAYTNEIFDQKDAWEDYQGLKGGWNESHTEFTPGSQQHGFGYSPGDADASGDGPILAAGGIAEGIEAYGNYGDYKQAQAKLSTLSSGDQNDPLVKSQIQAAQDTSGMAKRRGKAAATGFTAQAIEGGFHFAGGMGATSGVPGVSVVAGLYAAKDEASRAKDATKRAWRLRKLKADIGVTPNTSEKEDFETLKTAHENIEAGGHYEGRGHRRHWVEAGADDWAALNKHLGNNEEALTDAHQTINSGNQSQQAEMGSRRRRDQNRDAGQEDHQLRMRELMAQQHVSDIRSNASWRQGTKAALAGVSAAGHATSAAGSLTGGADLGMTKAIGTAAVSAAGTIRMGHGIRHRYKDAKRLARAKNYAEHDDSMGKRRMGKRGAGWAARQTTADLSKVGWSNLRTSRIAKALGAQGGTAREFRDRNEMRTLEEQGENIREQMVSNTADTKFKTRADDDMTASKAGAISDLATRRERLNAGRLIDYAGGQSIGVHAGNDAAKNARKVLGALDVGQKEGETWGMKEGQQDTKTRRALIEQYWQRADLRR